MEDTYATTYPMNQIKRLAVPSGDEDMEQLELWNKAAAGVN